MHRPQTSLLVACLALLLLACTVQAETYDYGGYEYGYDGLYGYGEDSSYDYLDDYGYYGDDEDLYYEVRM